MPARINSVTFDREDGETVTGNRTKVKVVKNKLAPPYTEAEFDIMYGQGISREGCVLDLAVECGLAKKSGAWYTYDGVQLGQGREKAKMFLADNAELTVALDEAIRKAYGVTAPGQESLAVVET